MFYIRTANLNYRFSAQQMYDELIQYSQYGELDKNDIPKVSTIQNWITSFSQKWKEIMAICELEVENI